MIRGLKFAENSWLFARYKRDTKNPCLTRATPYSSYLCRECYHHPPCTFRHSYKVFTWINEGRNALLWFIKKEVCHNSCMVPFDPHKHTLVHKLAVVDKILNWAKYKADQQIKKMDGSKREWYVYLHRFDYFDKPILST